MEPPIPGTLDLTGFLDGLEDQKLYVFSPSVLPKIQGMFLGPFFSSFQRKLPEVRKSNFWKFIPIYRQRFHYHFYSRLYPWLVGMSEWSKHILGDYALSIFKTTMDLKSEYDNRIRLFNELYQACFITPLNSSLHVVLKCNIQYYACSGRESRFDICSVQMLKL